MEKIYLVGENISYSLSPQIYEMLGVECEVKNMEDEEKLKEFVRSKQYDGLNVTIPYKKSLIHNMDRNSEIVRRTSVLNTVANKNGNLTGYNTDYYGIKKAYEHIFRKHKEVYIMGSGATCRTVMAYCKSLGINTHVISRTGELNYENIYEYSDEVKFICNTTPISGPNFPGERLLDLSKFKNIQSVIDINYSPYRTKLALGLPEDAEYINGLPMLVHQALMSFEIFTERKPKKGANAIHKRLLFNNLNITFIGMSCVGKTTISKEVARILNRPCINTDIETANGSEIAKIFKEQGEKYFRQKETETLLKYAYNGGQVIDTGGGIVLKEENRQLIKSNSVVVWLKTNREIKDFKGRPLIKNKKEYNKLASEREKIYEDMADVVIHNDRKPFYVAKTTIKNIKEHIDEININY